MMKKNWRTIVAMIVVIVMTFCGVTWMEEEWYETMSGVIWITGELLIVGIIMWRDLFALYKSMFD